MTFSAASLHPEPIQLHQPILLRSLAKANQLQMEDTFIVLLLHFIKEEGRGGVGESHAMAKALSTQKSIIIHNNSEIPVDFSWRAFPSIQEDLLHCQWAGRSMLQWQIL